MYLFVDEKEGFVIILVYFLFYSDFVKIFGLVQCMNIVISLVDLVIIVDVSELID